MSRVTVNAASLLSNSERAWVDECLATVRFAIASCREKSSKIEANQRVISEAIAASLTVTAAEITAENIQEHESKVSVERSFLLRAAEAIYKALDECDETRCADKTSRH